MIEQFDLFEKRNENGTTQHIIHGDCLDVMAGMDHDSIDFCVTDPPYGLHFMGKSWDSTTPCIDYWKHLIRILKPGSMMACAGSPRTYHRLACLIEDAGFEIRDCIMWLYGQGFPKSHNNFGLPGFGTQLKPSYEPIILAMKPLDGTYKENVERWGLGGINIDENRVGNDEIITQLRDLSSWHGNQWGNGGYQKPIGKSEPRQGRWPSNIILDEEAAKMLDQQSGILKSGENKPFIRKGKNPYSGGFGDYQGNSPSSSGGASRFFYCAKASSSERNKGLEGLPLKAAFDTNSGTFSGNIGSKSTLRQNNHPTVKPIALMKYIIKLLAPPNNPTLIDPFLGSGTTLLACKELNISAIGIEKEEEYVNIAKQRLEKWNG